MRQRLRGIGYAFWRAGGNLRRRPWAATLAIGASATLLVLVGVVRLADRNVDSMTARWGGGVQMIVYLEEGATAAHAQNISAILDDLPAVEGVRYVSKEEALDNLRRSLGEHDEIANGIEVGMLPASLEVTLADGVRDVASAHPVVQRLGGTAGVEEVEFLGEWVDRLTALVGGVRGAGVGLLVLVGLACIFVSAVTTRLAMRPRAKESRLSELFGAGPGFVRGPVLLEGAVQGLVAGALAAALLWFVYRATAPAIESTLSRAFGTAPVAFLPAVELLLLAGLGVVGGLVGACLGMERRAVA